MQPILVQVPPGAGPPSFPFHWSMQATEKPSCAARIAAMYPPGPPPITTTSKFFDMLAFQDLTPGSVLARHEYPQQDVQDQRDAAEEQAEREQQPPDPGVNPRRLAESTADAGDPLVGVRQAQAVGALRGRPQRIACTPRGLPAEQLGLGRLELGLGQRPVLVQRMQLSNFVSGPIV